MFEEIRHATARRLAERASRRLQTDCRLLLQETGELNGLAVASDLIDRIDALGDEQLDDFFDWLARELSPDPQEVLRRAQAYAGQPGAQALMALTAAVEPPRQELFRRLNRMPGGTAAVLRLRRALLSRVDKKP